jgi:transposase
VTSDGVPFLSRAEMESRRLEAADMFARGMSQAYIARHFSVSRTTVSRWSRELKQHGEAALRSHPAPGRPRRITADHEKLIVATFEAGPEIWGFERWSWARFAAILDQMTGIKYHGDHVGRIAKRLGLATGREWKRGRVAAGMEGERAGARVDAPGLEESHG